MKTTSRAFTLLELLLAMFAAAIIMAAIYGLFSKAVHLRNHAVELVRQTRLRARAAATLRDDLRGAIVTGGLLASVLEGSAQAPSSKFPGYLKFSTATARPDDNGVGGDVQQVEYFIASDTGAGSDPSVGTLVRTVERDPLSPTQTDLPQEPILSGVTALEVSFYDGAEWTNAWSYSTDSPTLPEAVRAVLRQPAPALPIEVEEPWATAPQAEASPTPP